MSEEIAQVCAYEPCSRPARITPLHFLLGVKCSSCSNIFCDEHHHDPIVHWCPFSDEGYWRSRESRDYDTEQEVMRSLLDVPALIEQAKNMRPGHDCTGPADEKERRGDFESVGGSNTHVLLTFDDGTKWIARMRVQRRYTPLLSARAINLQSEVATLRALYAGGLPVPNAWLPPAPLKDLEQVSHCFQEYVAGHDRRIDVQWDVSVKTPPRDHLGKRSRERCTNRFTQSLVGFGLQLEKTSFLGAGSLHFDSKRQVCVGPLITCQSTVDVDHPFLGPFSNAQEMYLAVLDYSISTIVQGRGAWSPNDAVLAYLAYRMARRLVEQCDEMKQGPFYVCHGEPKGDHLFFDDDYKLTGVIDWEWSYLSTKAEALQPPVYMRDRMFRIKGINAPSLCRKDLSDIILRQCRKYQRLSDLISLDIMDLQCLNAMSRAFLDLPDEAADQQPKTITEWMIAEASMLGRDRVLRQLLQRRSEWMKGQPARDQFVEEKRREIDGARAAKRGVGTTRAGYDRTGRAFMRSKMMLVW